MQSYHKIKLQESVIDHRPYNKLVSSTEKILSYLLKKMRQVKTKSMDNVAVSPYWYWWGQQQGKFAGWGIVWSFFSICSATLLALFPQPHPLNFLGKYLCQKLGQKLGGVLLVAWRLAVTWCLLCFDKVFCWNKRK